MGSINTFDLYRIENALWTLEQHRYEIINIAEEISEKYDISVYGIRNALNDLSVLAEAIRAKGW